MPWPTHVRTDELVSALRLFEDGGDLAHPDKIRACLSGTSALPWDTAPDISGLCRLVGLPRAAQLEGAKAFMLATGLSARVVRRTVVSKPGMCSTGCTLLFGSLEPGDLCRVAPVSGVLDARVAGERQRTAKWGAWKEGDGCPFKLLRLSALETRQVLVSAYDYLRVMDVSTRTRPTSLHQALGWSLCDTAPRYDCYACNHDMAARLPRSGWGRKMICRLRQMLTKTRLCAIAGSTLNGLFLRDLETENAALASTEPILLPDTPPGFELKPALSEEGGGGAVLRRSSGLPIRGHDWLHVRGRRRGHGGGCGRCTGQGSQRAVHYGDQRHCARADPVAPHVSIVAHLGSEGGGRVRLPRSLLLGVGQPPRARV